MTTLAISEARAKLTQLVNAVDKRFERFTITNHGKGKAVLISNDEYESLLETVEILSDPKLMAAIKKGDQDIKAGRTLTMGEVFKKLS